MAGRSIDRRERWRVALLVLLILALPAVAAAYEVLTAPGPG
jgi:hypothetical protein